MKVSPYLSFNGNCAEAVILYEKAFSTKAEVMLYKDADNETSADAENLVFHARLEIGGGSVMLHDVLPEEPVKFGDNIMLTIKFDDADAVAAKAAFDVLKEGGVVLMEMEATSWSKCFGLLTDKFGVSWNICQE